MNPPNHYAPMIRTAGPAAALPVPTEQERTSMTLQADTMPTNHAALAIPEGGAALPSRISWGAVLAGGVIAAAIAATLNIVGVAIGATTVDTVGRATPNAASLGIGAVVWMVVSNTLALGVGGYTAARLSGSADGTDGVLHGLAVWAVAFLVSATLLGNLVAGGISTAASTVSTVAGSAASGVGSAVSAVAGQASPEAMLQRAQETLRGTGGDPAAMTTEQRSAEIASLLARRAANGSFGADDRTRLNALVGAEYNIPAEEAAGRVRRVEEQAQRLATDAAQRTREAADATARATSIGAFGAFAALLLGAIAAVLGARRGTRDWVTLRSTGPGLATRTA